MAIDRYIIYVDTRDIEKMNKFFSGIGRNINQSPSKSSPEATPIKPIVGDSEKTKSDIGVAKAHPIRSTLISPIDYIRNLDQTGGTH